MRTLGIPIRVVAAGAMAVLSASTLQAKSNDADAGTWQIIVLSSPRSSVCHRPRPSRASTTCRN